MDRPLAGSKFLIPKREPRSLRARMPMVFQRLNLVQNQNVLDNVVEPKRLGLGRSRSRAEDRAQVALSMVGLTSRLRYYPMPSNHIVRQADELA